jgi:predicted ATP-dependent serine protease
MGGMADTSEVWFESEKGQRLLGLIGYPSGTGSAQEPIPAASSLTPGAQPSGLVSSKRAESDGRIRFAPIGQLLRDIPEEPPWNVASFVGPGVVTLLAGLPKAGKSTLVFAMLAALERGEPFLGEPVIPARALLLTEERHASLAEKQTTFGLSDDGLHVGMLHTVVGIPWEDVIDQSIVHCREHSLGLLIIDSFDKWTLADENSAQEVVAAMRPLMAAASEGLAVIVVHHSRKQKGRHATGVRGSTAFTGAVDVVAELDHGSEDVGGRLLRFTSRFADAPEPLSVTLDTPEGRLEAGDLSAAMAQAERETVLSAVTEEWQGWKAIAEIV